jgi:hypothetical protein
MNTNERPTPETDAAYFRRGITLYDLAGEMKRIERQRDEARDDANHWLNVAERNGQIANDWKAKLEEANQQIAIANAISERAEARLREFCRENPSRWTRLELMDIRDQLLHALDCVMQDWEGGYRPEEAGTTIGVVREAIAAAKAHENEMEEKKRED